jgi:O-antigen ligase
MANKIYQQAGWYFWILLLLLLPFTSLPIAGKLLHSNMVAAPSIIPLAILMLFWFLPGLLKIPLEPNSTPLIIFLCFAIISSLLSFWLPIPIQKNFSLLNNGIEAIATLIIGISFFMYPTQMRFTSQQMNATIKIICFSFVMVFVWSIFQFCVESYFKEYPDWMFSIQEMISTSGNLYRGRITGLAFEPSWLAHQLNVFYIPFFLSATITQNSVFKHKILRIKFETLLLFFAAILLFLTKSRIGWLTFLVCIGFIYLHINKILARKIITLVNLKESKILVFSMNLALLIILFGMAFLGLFGLSKIDHRMENLFNLDFYKNNKILDITNEFVFAERILYWQTGWTIFNQFPITGVGPGNSGFFFEENLPAYAWNLDEPRELVFRNSYQGNIKNLWLRILAENGVTGFIFFTIWLLILWNAPNDRKPPGKSEEMKWIFFGKIAIIALVIEGFSIDTYALPYYWLALGLYSRSIQKNVTDSN